MHASSRPIKHDLLWWSCLVLVQVTLLSTTIVAGFKVVPIQRTPKLRKNRHLSLSATRIGSKEARRNVLLSRSGPYFNLDKRSGNIEFGKTVFLRTKLSRNYNYESICEWIQNERDLAMSIWDKDKIKELGQNVYRLQLMKLQFVTIELQPTVDVKMYTNSNGGKNAPVFLLESTDFEPNVKLFPGLGIVSAEVLGIKIEVYGEMKPTNDGTGVAGKIAFQTAGKLPPPLRIAPSGVIKLAGETINNTIANFAIKSFESSALQQYKKFLRTKARKAQN